MGGATSSLTPEDIEELRDPSISGFSAAEIKQLYKRFHHLDRSHSGFLTQNDMQLIPELSLNPLCNRVIELFDKNSTNQINFRDFVRTLWVFSSNAPKELKIQCAFDVFDVDRDGKISEDDLFSVMTVMVGKNFPSQKLTQIVSNLIKSGQLKKDEKRNYLTPQELIHCIGEQEIVNQMTMPFIFSS